MAAGRRGHNGGGGGGGGGGGRGATGLLQAHPHYRTWVAVQARRGLQLQSLWIIPAAAAVGSHGAGAAAGDGHGRRGVRSAWQAQAVRASRRCPTSFADHRLALPVLAQQTLVQAPARREATQFAAAAARTGAGRRSGRSRWQARQITAAHWPRAGLAAAAGPTAGRPRWSRREGRAAGAGRASARPGRRAGREPVRNQRAGPRWARQTRRMMRERVVSAAAAGVMWGRVGAAWWPRLLPPRQRLQWQMAQRPEGEGGGCMFRSPS